MDKRSTERQLNKWTWPDSEIVALINSYKLEVPNPWDRKTAIDLLNQFEETGGPEKLVEQTKKDIEKLLAERPELRLITVVFHSAGENDVPYVPVGINGSFFYFPMDKEVKVPQFILGVINDAVEERSYPITNPLTGKITWKRRKIQRFPYSIVSF